MNMSNFHVVGWKYFTRTASDIKPALNLLFSVHFPASSCVNRGWPYGCPHLTIGQQEAKLNAVSATSFMTTKLDIATYILSKILVNVKSLCTWILLNVFVVNLAGREEDPKMQEVGCCGRVAKVMDLKSIGVSCAGSNPANSVLTFIMLSTWLQQ